MKQRIKQVISKTVNIQENLLEDNTHLKEELNCDLRDMTEIFMALEDEFKINIPQKEECNLCSVKKIHSYINKK